MAHLTREDLMSLEEYAEQRNDFRARVIAHKKDRQVELNPHMTLYFEDQLTMQYQVQEMLRIEKIFDRAGIEDELAVYNPLIPDGRNWKATFMIEYPDIEERKQELAKLIGVEDKVWVGVEGHDKSYAIADEDLERDTADKTSAVHFMRFELSDAMARDARAGAKITMGVDHEHCRTEIVVAENIRASLVEDLA
ncbi:MAG: DUF3501 family protein [Gammaproteobacteria bacterium]